MAVLLTIQEAIDVGEVSIYLAGNDNASGVLWGKRLNSPYSPVQIAACTDALLWQYEDYPTDETLRGTANYLIWMCGKYGLQAQYIISGSGGGSVTPVPPGATVPLPLQFIVASSGTTFIDGQTSVTLTQFIGFNLLFARGGIAQSDVDTESSFYSWSKTTGILTISPQAYTGELFQIYPI